VITIYSRFICTNLTGSLASSESKDEMEGGLFLDVIVGEGSSILELLSGEDESLLIGRNSFLVLDLGLDVLDGVGWLDVEGDGLSGESLDEDLHTSSESEDEMEGGFLLDVVVGEGSSILELLSSEDKSLLIGWNSFLVLDLGLDVLNGVGWLNIKGDGLTGQGLDEDLHSSSKSEDEMEGRLFLDVVVGEGSAVFELLSSEDESLLIGRDTLLVLDLGLDILDSVCWLDIKGDGLTSQGLYEDLHLFGF
jgi:streptomycin 6-kinase